MSQDERDYWRDELGPMADMYQDLQDPPPRQPAAPKKKQKRPSIYDGILAMEEAKANGTWDTNEPTDLEELGRQVKGHIPDFLEGAMIADAVSGGIGAYLGVGGSSSWHTIKCCKNGCKYQYSVLTACSGVGLSANLSRLTLPSGSASSGTMACPPDIRRYFQYAMSFHAVYGRNLGVNQGLNEYPWEATPFNDPDWTADVDIGFNFSYCSDTVVKKKLIGSCD